ncbi:hypothetical protein EI427_14000 [Flammeovirga pectinis]|uniref:AbiEi antitoxin C-terminal domain-containing protein n=1 Tax=Flammeovirga pectinis TaxID=2494373 RepID=A0A3S9P538_9BACT|nr:DUF6088 family protein [Flammeovirga pectinis]AZQ63311.1 hypothetical protein EI427_14000 [Flammeovirga pectinis]
MKTTDYILSKIKNIPEGYVFTSDSFLNEDNTKTAVVKALSRMMKSGVISKLSKGKFYKAKQSVFGELAPSMEQELKDLLEVNGKVIGYLTGTSIYNQLGLTTQVSNTIQIGRNEVRPQFKRGIYTIKYIKQKNTLSKANIPYLQLLDAIHFIKKIPDATIKETCERIKSILKEKKEEDKERLIFLAKKYAPSTRALLGALLDDIEPSSLTDKLFKTLNPVTTYPLNGAKAVLSTTQKWHIV